jgi:Uma2 family endonuclease
MNMGIAKEIAINRIYTHEDLENFPDNELWELLEGTPYQMAPPSDKHQRISMELSWQFANYLREKGKPCEIFAVPFGVYLPNTKKKSQMMTLKIQKLK